MAASPWFDRVLETTTTTGTGTLALTGAVTGYQSFAAIGDGNTTPMAIWEVDANGNPSGAWEVATVCTYTAAGTTLTRGTFQASSTGSTINFAAGTKRVAQVLPVAVLNLLAYDVANKIVAAPYGAGTVASDLLAWLAANAFTGTLGVNPSLAITGNSSILPALYFLHGNGPYSARTKTLSGENIGGILPYGWSGAAIVPAGVLFIEALSDFDAGTPDYRWTMAARNIRICTSVVTPELVITPGLASITGAASILGTAGAGYIDLLAQSANPAAPSAGTLRIHSATTQGFTRLEQDNEAATNLIYARDSVLIAKNTSGSDMAKGVAVRVTGSTGAVPNISLAQANSSTTMPAIGLTLDAILNNAVGQVMLIGVVDNFNTNSWNSGDQLFVSTSAAGGLQNTRPSGTTNIVQRVGSVLNKGVGDGSMMIDVAPAMLNVETGTNAATWSATALDLTDVAAPASPAAGHVAVFGDSTDLRLHDKNAAGTIGTTVVADTGAANNFLTAISAAGVISKAQPAFSNLSGTATIAQLLDGAGLKTYICGLLVTRNSTTAIDISAGFAYDPSSGKVLTYAGTTALSGGTLGASQWNQVYLFDNSGTPTIEIVNNADPPSTTYQGTARQGGTNSNRRWLGSFKTNASSQIIAQNVRETAANGVELVWLTDPSVSPFRVLSAGTAASLTAVSLAAPVVRYAGTEALLYGIVDNGSSNTVNTIDISIDGTNRFLTVAGWSPSASAFPAVTFGPIPMEASTPQLWYKITATGTPKAYIDVSGYRYAR